MKHVKESALQLFSEAGRVLQILPVDNELFIIARDVDPQRGVANVAYGCHVRNGFRDLQSVQSKIATKIKDVEGTSKHAQNSNGNRGELHALIMDVATEVGDILSRAEFPLLPSDPADVLLVCADPTLLGLPWSLVPIGGRLLIERVRSLTLSSSIGASTVLAELATKRDFSEPFDIAAYCDCGRHGELKWSRMFHDQAGKPCGSKSWI